MKSAPTSLSDLFCTALNRMLQADPEGLFRLIETRVPVGSGLVEDPHAQCIETPGGYVLGPLGLLNGILGEDRICAEYSDDQTRIESFKPYRDR